MMNVVQNTVIKNYLIMESKWKIEEEELEFNREVYWKIANFHSEIH